MLQKFVKVLLVLVVTMKQNDVVDYIKQKEAEPLEMSDVEEFIQKSTFGFEVDSKQKQQPVVTVKTKNTVLRSQSKAGIKPIVIEADDEFAKNHWEDTVQRIEYNSFHGYGTKNTIIHLAGWSYTDIESECSRYRNTYGAILVSPITEHCMEDSWDERYNVLSYTINNESGTEEEFINMVKNCNLNKVRIIVDVVINNMSKDGLQNCPVKDKSYPQTLCELCGELHPLYEKSNFHGTCTIQPLDYKNNADKVRQCELKGRHDLILVEKNGKVNNEVVMFLTKLIIFGVAGFRVLAADHIDPMELNKLYSLLPTLRVEYDFPPRSRPFILNDVFDPFHDKSWAIHAQDYVRKGRVTDYKYALKLGEYFIGNKKSLKNLISWTNKSFVPNKSSVVFLTTDSLQALKGGLGGYPPIKKEHIFNFEEYLKAEFSQGMIAIMLAATYLFSQNHDIILITSSSSYLSKGKALPKINETNKVMNVLTKTENKMCRKEFICEHRWNIILSLIEFNIYIRSDMFQKSRNIL
ncbi:alpha-amylase-related protein-like isoform X2 [Lycorma delicatula]|uniref:alpha-amylase-related protein-like isoform X2 n=1 Tax=Lycorma delicatula TaxID=130591 RepID=UPI003F50D859